MNTTSTTPYDPPSDAILATVAAEVVDAVNASVGEWHHREREPGLADALPPFVREFDVGYACVDDWHGGDPGPGVRRVFDDLRDADAIRPLRPAAVAALLEFRTRWAQRHGAAAPRPDVEAATWEVVDVDRFERVLSGYTRHPRWASAEVRNGVDRHRD
ncbi:MULTISPECIES: hypothetical protein [unclassified Curtobacterium]|uniref:hypothetical protein n=1 Tax=unclassified Curtobacterium TaxID=257496 RepID=UPI0037F1C9FC